MASSCPKQYLEIRGRSVLRHTLERLHQVGAIRDILLMVQPDDPWFNPVLLEGLDRVRTAEGGEARSESVLRGLDALSAVSALDDWVLVHDAVRPCVSAADIERLMASLADDTIGGLLACPVRETLKRVDAAGRVEATLDRQVIRAAATPQMFRFGLLHAALREALAAGLTVTDESAAMELAGYSPVVVEGRSDNIKITYPEDLGMAADILARQSSIPSGEPGP